MEFEFHLASNDFVTLLTLNHCKYNSGRSWVRLRFKSGLFQSTAFSRLGQVSCTRLHANAGLHGTLPWCHFAPAVLRGARLKMHTNYPCSFAATIKCLESRPFPNSSFMTGPIHFLFVDTVWLVFYQCSHCAWLSWGRVFYFPLAKFPSFFFLTVKAWWGEKKKGFSEMAIRSLRGLDLLGYLPLGYQSIQLNEVETVLAKFVVSSFLNFYIIGRSYAAVGRALIIIWSRLCAKHRNIYT